MSQLLLRIEERLRTETDSYLVAELNAVRAGYLARLGRFQDAKDTIAEVRQVFSDGRSGRVTALLMIAEALAMYYERLASEAADRVARALLLGHAMKDQEIIAIAAAWKAFLDFESSKFESAFRTLKTSLDHAEESNHAAWTRNCVVLALGFSLCGDFPSSQHWFLKGRHHALEEGDQVSLEALLHNKAVFSVAWLRVQRCRGATAPQQIARARLELSSTRNLQELAGVSAHGSYIDLAHARLLIVEQRFKEALEALDGASECGPYPSGHFNHSLLGLERAFCLANLGQSDEAFEAMAAYDETQVSSLDVDDRLISAWMMCELSKIDSRFGNGEECRSRLASISQEQDQLVARLSSFLGPFSKT